MINIFKNSYKFVGKFLYQDRNDAGALSGRKGEGVRMGNLQIK